MRLLIFLLILCATPSFAQLKGRVLEINSKSDTTAVVGVVLFWIEISRKHTTEIIFFFSLSLSLASSYRQEEVVSVIV